MRKDLENTDRPSFLAFFFFFFFFFFLLINNVLRPILTLLVVKKLLLHHHQCRTNTANNTLALHILLSLLSRFS